MPNLRRSVFRLLLVTCFLLAVAWVSLKLMQFNGDWERLLKDLQDNQIALFAREKVVPFFQEKIIPFIREKVGPLIKQIFESVKGLIPSTGH